MSHKLDPLLRPQSIAIVGASQRVETVGNMVLRNLLLGKFPGNLYTVNPRYTELEGIACFASLAELPEVVEHVIFAVSDERIEDLLDSAITHGAKASTIFSSLVLANDSSTPLKERIHRKVSEAGMLLCGANGMGFFNFTDGIWIGGFDTRSHTKWGNVSLISQSGAGMSGILDVDERIDFNFAVSTGQELIVSAEDYLDYVLEQEETRVIGFFMETSRKPDQLIAAFEKARQKQIPIVVLKVGRTALASELAVSHSGAMAGSDTAYNAIFECYGVQRVADMDQLATSLIMFAQPHPIQAGGIVSLHDSGGEQQLIIDLADELDVVLAEISGETKVELKSLLDPGLPAVNPLDAWSAGGPEYHRTMENCFATLLKDPDAALGAVVHDRAPFGHIYSEYIGYLRMGHAASAKAVFLVSNRQGTGEDRKVVESTREGFPVLDGLHSFLVGAKSLMAYRDYLARPTMSLPKISKILISKWQERFNDNPVVEEHEAGEFLSDFGMPVIKSTLIRNKEEFLDCLPELKYPVVMKTAMEGVSHKSDVRGVVLNIENEEGLQACYDDMSSRLGPKVLIAAMNNNYGIEMILGIARDKQFGPLIIMGFGGVNAEILNDVAVLKPPFDANTALRYLKGLKMKECLYGVRGNSAVDVSSFCNIASLVSVLAIEFENQIVELDINPLKIMEKNCMALDALLVLGNDSTRPAKTSSEADVCQQSQAR